MKKDRETIAAEVADIEEARLRGELHREEAQQLIDQRIREMECQDTQSICETLNSSRLASEHRLAQDMSVEELYDVIAKEIDYIYENG